MLKKLLQGLNVMGLVAALCATGALIAKAISPELWFTVLVAAGVVGAAKKIGDGRARGKASAKPPAP